MKEKLKEAAELLQACLDYPECELCGNINKECMWCEKKGSWSLSEEASESLINKIENILIPTGYWIRYTDDDEYYCSHCEWPAPRDAYGKFRDQPAYCPVCGARMIDKDSLELAKEYGE